MTTMFEVTDRYAGRRPPTLDVELPTHEGDLDA